MFSPCHFPAQNLFLDPSYTNKDNNAWIPQLLIQPTTTHCSDFPLVPWTCTQALLSNSAGTTLHIRLAFQMLCLCSPHPASPAWSPFLLLHPFFCLSGFGDHFKSCPPETIFHSSNRKWSHSPNMQTLFASLTWKLTIRGAFSVWVSV